jgi:GNAT superfamily N-acetyltransferase
MAIEIKGPLFNQGSVCEPIIRSLPEWFGLEPANQQFVRDISTHPTFVAYVGGEPAGFMTVKQHNPYAAEIYVCGVRPEYHRHGLGKAMLASIEAYLRSQGTEYLQVKTLGPSHPDEGYNRTRQFYASAGFRPLEEMPWVWGPDNPCLVMVKHLAA